MNRTSGTQYSREAPIIINVGHLRVELRAANFDVSPVSPILRRLAIQQTLVLIPLEPTAHKVHLLTKPTFSMNCNGLRNAFETDQQPGVQRNTFQSISTSTMGERGRRGKGRGDPLCKPVCSEEIGLETCLVTTKNVL